VDHNTKELVALENRYRKRVVVDIDHNNQTKNLTTEDKHHMWVVVEVDHNNGTKTLPALEREF
jgi:hypothetical protein